MSLRSPGFCALQSSLFRQLASRLQSSSPSEVDTPKVQPHAARTVWLIQALQKPAVIKGILLATLLGVSHSAQSGTLQQGANAIMYGRCDVDVLTPDRVQMAAALAALAPDALSRLAPAPDELAQIEHMCAYQVHQHRCTQKIVKIAGAAITKQHPAGKASPPSVNPGTIVGGLAGAVVGGLIGNERSTGAAVIGAAAGGWGGAKLGEKIYDGGVAASCVHEQATLDTISSRLQGTVRYYSPQGVIDLIESNRVNQIISDQDAADLNGEIVRLANQSAAVVDAAR